MLAKRVKTKHTHSKLHIIDFDGLQWLKAALTETFTVEVSRLPYSRLLVNHNGKLNTKNYRLPAEVLPWTRMRAGPFGIRRAS
ncbi:hypothetical protein Y032_0044g953 [Ancylostoma ceylanicum]|uniref:Uncharacterized protein n=1 Tax=Ancylostoma ceylanicum TaxID=53326 RepID=A0A016UDX6_9BILA|nr:hypothetical protein Y032_0044g953 [Ancylostoma ceylanicum]